MVNSEDPKELGRLQVIIPAFPSLVESWAMPCVPFAGEQLGMVTLPPPGTNVWLEFEGGDPSRPIWTGFFWGEGEKPAEALTELQKVFQTASTTVVIDDAPGEATVTMTLRPPGVEIPVEILLSPTGLRLQTAEASVLITPEEIRASIAGTSITMTPETINVLTEGKISIEAPNTSIVSDIQIEGNMTVTGAVEVTGDTSITGEVNVTGNTSITGAVEITGACEITGDATITGDTTVTGAFEITGMTNMVGMVAVEGPMEALALECLDITTAAVQGTGEGAFVSGGVLG